MTGGTISQTALKVALTMVVLNEKAGWNSRLPEGTARLSERLILAAAAPGYGPRLLRMSRMQWMVRLYDLSEFLLPGTFEGLGERKIFMNEQVLEAIENGATQVLILGAGFDTLCLRLASRFPRVRFFELDHPATSAAKARGVDREGRPVNMIMIAADLSETSLSEQMAHCEQWDPGARSVLVAEGLLMYLEVEGVLELFREAASCVAPGSRLVFSHLFEPTKHRFARVLLRWLREPWLSAAASADLQEYIGRDWKVISRREGRPGRDIEGFAVAERLDSVGHQETTSVQPHRRDH